MALGVRTNSEVLREMWRRHFSQVALTVTKWFEKYDSSLLEECFRIAAENLKNGKQLRNSDEESLRRYVGGVIRRKTRSQMVKVTSTGGLVTSQFCFYAGYKITETDRRNFEKRLERAGDCLLFNGRSTTGYRRFWVNKQSIWAHRFAYFSQLGYLPAPGELGGRNGLQVAHICRNRACCNPLHLRLTTKSVNLMERGEPAQDITTSDYGSTNGSDLSRCSSGNSDVSHGLPCDDPLADPSVAQRGINIELNDIPSSFLPSTPQTNTEHLRVKLTSSQTSEIPQGVTGDDEITI